ncbi:uncharacterized protein T551_00334 [Pneumocystis jirovecii RU7]|uniref:Ribosomal RNA-processing protein 1 n=1 Tax=Pneumocystis jirovecii (strain RU7) TaxID=1408657 RepID=A0A0W4ZV65_PNEJ7|nr:uncharacterized protein T551_00334 [Pneumocystis jirovecii RU7]KTW32243.1 hypothetical protein T551_00334 [Pneumocystis jirovecii RU7]
MIIEKSPKISELKQLTKKFVSNDKKTRDSAVMSLSHFLSSRSHLSYSELLKLWKGLFYCMWMSDRSFTQQKLANDLANLVSKCSTDNALLFLKAFWETICREWISIDILRLNKFYLLIRKYIEQGFRICMMSSWSEEVLKKYIFLLKSIPLNPLNPKIPNSIRYHVSDVYLDELDKVFSEKTQTQNFPIQILLEPFVYLFKKTPDKYVRKRISENIFQDKRIELWLNKKGDHYSSDLKMLNVNNENI